MLFSLEKTEDDYRVVVTQQIEWQLDKNRVIINGVVFPVRRVAENAVQIGGVVFFIALKEGKDEESGRTE